MKITFYHKNKLILGKIAFNYLGPKIWKEVPNDLRNCSYYAFEKMKSYLIIKYII